MFGRVAMDSSGLWMGVGPAEADPALRTVGPQSKEKLIISVRPSMRSGRHPLHLRNQIVSLIDQRVRFGLLDRSVRERGVFQQLSDLGGQRIAPGGEVGHRVQV